jgi:hypothetical protein
VAAYTDSLARNCRPRATRRPAPITVIAPLRESSAATQRGSQVGMQRRSPRAYKLASRRFACQSPDGVRQRRLQEDVELFYGRQRSPGTRAAEHETRTLTQCESAFALGAGLATFAVLRPIIGFASCRFGTRPLIPLRSPRDTPAREPGHRFRRLTAATVSRRGAKARGELHHPDRLTPVPDSSTLRAKPQTVRP